jgi:hypothetical protein
MEPTEIFQLFAGLIALVAMLAFLFLYGNAIRDTWAAEKDPQGKLPVPEFRPQYEYVATVLAGLIGGVAAMAFNLEYPKVPEKPGAIQKADAKGEAEPPAKVEAAAEQKVELKLADIRVARFEAALGLINVKGWQNFAKVSYVLIYFVVGLVAIITWVGRDNTPNLVKNLALIAFGMFIAIARSFVELK